MFQAVFCPSSGA